MSTRETTTIQPMVSVIIPARNEEANLGACLASLVAQTGVAFEIIVVDDHSTDRTRDIALSFPNVRVLEARPLPEGWTGKNNAVTTGALVALGEWMLFTDADTVHLPGSLTRSLEEAKRQGAALLSYSPEQIVKGFWEKAVMPVIFAELASNYRPSEVSDPLSPVAAANGQYLLISREAYDAVGGHAALASTLLEDVALARTVKQSGRKIFFRYAADTVRTRMYRTFAQLREGWTKNLALLFPRPCWLASWIVAWWLFSWIAFLVGVVMLSAGFWRVAYYLIPTVSLYLRIRRANFRLGTNLVALGFGPPLFAYLLLRSKRAHDNGSVLWKGRTYSDHPTPPGSASQHTAGQPSLLESRP